MVGPELNICFKWVVKIFLLVLVFKNLQNYTAIFKNLPLLFYTEETSFLFVIILMV